MAAKLYYQEDCNLSVLEGQTIAFFVSSVMIFGPVM